MSMLTTADNAGPDTHDGHDWEGFSGGCQRLGCGPDCARQEIARLRAQLEPKTIRELIEHKTLKSLSEKQINDVLVRLNDELREAKAKLADQPASLPDRRAAIGAIIEAQLSIKDCLTGTANWASRIYDAIAAAGSKQRQPEKNNGHSD